MSGPFRLSRSGHGDRSRALSFYFNGREYLGFEGDSIASALLGAGVSVVGRSMKFHRPRGVFSAGIEEPNALLTVGTRLSREPSVRATTRRLSAGLWAESQNSWPSLGFDIGRVNDAAYRLLPAGFYNKTFIWPSWHVFEPAIRHVAGLGVAPDGPDPDRYEWRNVHCDVLVVGGGMCGMLAAYLAGRNGARVLLIDGDQQLGGGLNWSAMAEARARVDECIRQLKLLPGLRVLLRTHVVGSYDHGFFTAYEELDSCSQQSSGGCRARWWRIRAKRVVLATGAVEQPLAFPFNDRPGILLADAARHYLNRYDVAVGSRVVLATNNDSAYDVALDLRAAGISVPCVLDSRTEPTSALVSKVVSMGIDVFRGAHILRTWGSPHIRALEFSAETSQYRTVRIECDALGMSGGWNPTTHLHCQAGGRLRFDPHHACLVPDARLETMLAVGAAAGQFSYHAALEHICTRADGFFGNTEVNASWTNPLPGEQPRAPTGRLGYSRPEYRARIWLDFQHDVTVSDIDLTMRENLVSIEHVKRYTTVGMSVDQGKTSNLNTLAVVANLTGRPISEVGTTTFRPLFTPVTLGAIAGGRTGRFYSAERLLAAHAQHQALGAQVEDYGAWQRPAYYPRAGESRTDAIQREARQVRMTAGLFDASPLGKVLVRGPDATEFLDRIYANTMKTLEPGRVRYGLMLNERGIIIDDGVCARLSSSEYWINTTSSGAARVAGWFDEWLQGEWPELRVLITDVTSAWATVDLAGPRARDILSAVSSDIDFGRQQFPHMHVRSGALLGVPCRVLRVSYTGELSYEISVPAVHGESLWSQLYDAGREAGITPFGVEAMLLLRTEKGYLHVGSDTDGTTVPGDIGFGVSVARKVGDFVGRRSLSLPENVRPDRLQLVGLRCGNNAEAFNAGAHLLDESSQQMSRQSSGYLTSAVFSPTLGLHVGLGLLRNGRARLGQTVCVIDDERQSTAEVVPVSHLDPAGERLNA